MQGGKGNDAGVSAAVDQSSGLRIHEACVPSCKLAAHDAIYLAREFLVIARQLKLVHALSCAAENAEGMLQRGIVCLVWSEDVAE